MSPITLAGLDKYQPSRVLVENNTGVTVPSLKAVRLNGMGTSYPQVILANPSLGPVFGIVIEPILNGAVGQALTWGLAYNINTSAWAPNSNIYSDGAGNLSTTPLSSGDSPVALVIKQDALYGIMYVTCIISQIHGTTPEVIGVGKNLYSEITAVPSGPTVTVQTYTVPADKTGYLMKVTVSGTNIAEFAVLINGVIQDKRRTWFCDFNEDFDFLEQNGGIQINAGDIVTVTVNHWRPALGDFNSKILVTEV